ncbi:MAG: phenylalanine--tRNA ligase beta subunit-related protein [Pseudomonadota bacterium]
MKLIIADEIRKNYPDLRIGVVIAEQVDNKEHSEELLSYTKNKFWDFIDKYITPQQLREHKNIQAWREIYKSFGVKPKKHKPTAEALLTRVLKQFIPKISPAVDCYLISESIHCLPIGGYDIDQIEGDITLRYSKGNEDFIGIGSDKKDTTDEGEVIYSDSKRVLTRRWNYRDCDNCKIDVDSKRIALFVEGALDVIDDSEIKETIDDISSNLKKFCKAETKTFFLGKDKNDIQILP